MVAIGPGQRWPDVAEGAAPTMCGQGGYDETEH